MPHLLDSAAFTSLPQPAPAAQADILDYIHNTWDTLRRSMNECSSVVDPKLGVDAQTVLYLPSAVVAPSEVADLGKKCQVRVQRLPEQIMHLGEVMPGQLPIQGLLFLPNPYVVPGGRLNEMYGWDSYFIIRGLLEDGRRDLAAAWSRTSSMKSRITGQCSMLTVLTISRAHSRRSSPLW